MSCAKVPNLRSFQNGLIPLSRSSTHRRYSPILGITSWYQSLLRPRSPHWLIESLTVESRHTLENVLSPIFISESRISLLLMSFHSGEDSWRLLLPLLLSKIAQFFLGSREYCLDCSDVFVTRTLFSMPPIIRGCGSVPGSWALRCCCHKYIASVLEYLRRPTSKTLLCG